MATLAGDLADTLLLRVRDPDATAHARPFVLRLLTQCQRLINAETRAVLSSADLTADASSTILDIQHLLPWAIRVETIRDGIRDVQRCGSWHEIAGSDRYWLKRTAGRPVVWCHFTPARILLYPAPIDPMTLTLIYTLKTNILTETTPLQLPFNLEPAILDLAEEIILVRQRLFLSIKPVAERFEQALLDTSR